MSGIHSFLMELCKADDVGFPSLSYEPGYNASRIPKYDQSERTACFTRVYEQIHERGEGICDKMVCPEKWSIVLYVFPFSSHMRLLTHTFVLFQIIAIKKTNPLPHEEPSR